MYIYPLVKFSGSSNLVVPEFWYVERFEQSCRQIEFQRI